MKAQIGLDSFKIRKLRRDGEKINLDSSQLKKLTEVAVHAFGSNMTMDEVAEHVLPVDALYIAEFEGVVCGFGSLNIFEDHSYLAGTVIDPREQKKGVYSRLAQVRILDTLAEGVRRVDTRTQNPIIEYSIMRSLELLRAGKHIEGFDVERLHVPGVYGRMLTEERPFSKDSELNEIYNQLSYESGDAFKLAFHLR